MGGRGALNWGLKNRVPLIFPLFFTPSGPGRPPAGPSHLRPPARLRQQRLRHLPPCLAPCAFLRRGELSMPAKHGGPRRIPGIRRGGRPGCRHGLLGKTPLRGARHLKKDKDILESANRRVSEVAWPHVRAARASLAMNFVVENTQFSDMAEYPAKSHAARGGDNRF